MHAHDYVMEDGDAKLVYLLRAIEHALEDDNATLLGGWSGGMRGAIMIEFNNRS